MRDALKTVGVNIPGCDARFLEDEFKKSDENKDGKLSFDEFQKVIFLNLNLFLNHLIKSKHF